MPDDQTTVAPTQDEPGQVKPDKDNERDQATAAAKADEKTKAEEKTKAKDKAEDDLALVTLQRMLKDEAVHLDGLRKAQWLHSDGRRERVGLALSGGGIRSATFSLGVIQALAEKGLIASLDYISTVSGGGYIGAWLSACIHRARNAGKLDPVRDVEARITRQIAGRGPEEAAEVRFLRAYSNYLTPRLGLFSGDTLAALSGFLRNLTLNLVLGVLSALTVLATIHFVLAFGVLAFTYGGPANLGEATLSWLGIAFASISFCLTFQSHDLRKLQRLDRMEGIPGVVLIQRVVGRVAVVLLCGGLSWASIWIYFHAKDFGPLQLVFVVVVAVIAMVLGSLIAYACIRLSGPDKVENLEDAVSLIWLSARVAIRDSRNELTRYGVASGVCGAAFLFALVWFLSFVGLAELDEASTIHVVALGPAIGVMLLWFLFILWIGAVGNHYSEYTREWLSRFLGELSGLAGLWMIMSALVVHARPVWQWSFDKGHQLAQQRPPLTAFGVLVVIGLASAALWVLRRSRVARTEKAESEVKRPVAMTICWVIVGMFVFASAVGFQELLFLLKHHGPKSALATDRTYSEMLGDHIGQLKLALSWPALVTFLVIGGVTYLAFLCVDVNTFSLQNLYRNRLVRCYLGAAHGADRLPNPYTGFDPDDEFALKELANQRPYLLINAALNITQGQDLAWQQRKAAAFLLSPRWCGYWLESTEMSGVAGTNSMRGGYVQTSDYVREERGFRSGPSDGVMIGTAMATSGAAVSSQMGFASRGPLAFVLTLLNLRLGRWLPNTYQRAKMAANRDEMRKSASPPFGAFWYLRELFGMTSERSSWVYVSDGGHFENLGIYELVRRRCARIVCVDAGADPGRTFADLGNAVQKCRVDLGVSIAIDVSGLQIDERGFSAEAFRVGTIVYPATGDEDGFEGRLLYIKPSLLRTSEEVPGDILAYHSRHPEFPHEATTNQWFSESQFESYRHLGYLIGQNALSAVAHPGNQG